MAPGSFSLPSRRVRQIRNDVNCVSEKNSVGRSSRRLISKNLVGLSSTNERFGPRYLAVAHENQPRPYSRTARGVTLVSHHAGARNRSSFGCDESKGARRAGHRIRRGHGCSADSAVKQGQRPIRIHLSTQKI